ncbi:pre-mRNA-splicing factor ATP-dependent RNA helicase PRP16, partial [Thalictrum thalictroides]
MEGRSNEGIIPNGYTVSAALRGCSGIQAVKQEKDLTPYGQVRNAFDTPLSVDHPRSEVLTPSSGNSRSARSRSPSRYDYHRDGHHRKRRDSRDDTRNENRRVRHRDSDGRNEKYYGRDVYDRHGYGQKYSEESERRHSQYENPSRRTPGRSVWDDGRYEWEDTPHRDSYSRNDRNHRPSPSPMLVGASPDARLVSPWLGGHTPYSTGPSASPWDHISPSPVPIRASGYSARSSSSRLSGRSHQQKNSADNSEPDFEDDMGRGSFGKEQNQEITETMRLEMEYNSDRAWYDREEGNTAFDADSSSFYLGDEASLQKKKADMAKRLVRKDGTQMTLAQSKKLSQLNADNAQWEDRQLLRSGAVRGTELQTEFDDEDERKVILLVHDTKPPFLDGRVVFTKQAEPIMPLKDPTSDMAIISRKGSVLVREIHEKQSMNKSRQRFWELAGSKL